MAVESISGAKTAPLRQRQCLSGKTRRHFQFHYTSVRASQSMDDRNKVYKELGLYSLKKKIEDVVVRAEIMAPDALEHETARQIQQEEMVQKYNLWDDPAKSDEILTALADSTKVVDALKDLQFKIIRNSNSAEEAKLITQLAEMDVINYQLFKQAYKASVDVSKFMDHYKMSKLLGGPYDAEGACLIIRAESNSVDSELWAERLLNMYTKWGKKQGLRGRIMEKCTSKLGGIKSATIEFESKFCYGYLSGERGTHLAVGNSLDGSIVTQACIASVDVIPLFLEVNPDLHLDDEDLEISLVPSCGDEILHNRTFSVVSICHRPTGVKVQCSGERNHFSNKMKSLNRLKAKLAVTAEEQGVTDVSGIRKTAILDSFRQETRRYVFQPYKLVKDVNTGTQLTDLTSVLDGNLEAFIGAHISLRYAKNSC